MKSLILVCCCSCCFSNEKYQHRNGVPTKMRAQTEKGS